MQTKLQKINPILMSQYNAMLQIGTEDSTEKVKSDIMQFFSLETIAEAKALFKKLFPNCDGKSHFRMQGVEISICEKIKGRSITGWGDFLAIIQEIKSAIAEIIGDSLEALEHILNLYENGIRCCKQAINIFGLTQSQLSMVEELDFEFQIERNKAIIEFNTSGLENYEYSPVLYEAYKEAVMGDNTELIESYIDAILSCSNVPDGIKDSLEDMENSLNSKTATGENSIIPTQPNWNGNYVDHLSPQNKIKYQVAIDMSSDDDIALRRRLLETFREILTDPCFNNPENAPFKIYLQICCEQLRQFLNNYNRKQSMTVQHEQTAMK